MRKGLLRRLHRRSCGGYRIVEIENRNRQAHRHRIKKKTAGRTEGATGTGEGKVGGAHAAREGGGGPRPTNKIVPHRPTM